MANKKENTVFVNPLETGVSYVDFKSSIPEGVTIKEHLEGKLTEEEIQWIEAEIGFFDFNNLKVEEVGEVKEVAEN